MRKLQPREIAFLAGGGAFLLLIFGIWVFQVTVLEKMSTLDRQIQARQTELEELRGLASQYLQLQARQRALEIRLQTSGKEPLLLRLNQVLRQTRMEMDSFQPQGEVEVENLVESTAEVQFSRVPLNSIFQLLRKLTLGNDIIAIKRLAIERRFENPDQLDLTLVLSSFRPQS